MPKTQSEIFEFSNWNELEIARQMTLTTQFIYCKIDPLELVNAHWTKKDKHLNSPNVMKLIDRFNRISFWLAEEILAYDNTYQRALVLNKLVEIAVELKKMANFNDLVNVLSVFNLLPIGSLKKSFKKVNQMR